MLGAARSGQLLLRALRSSSSATSLLPSTSITPARWSRLASMSPLSSLISRSFHTTLPRRSYAQAQEDETEYSSSAPSPPTSSQATGPVTRFSELAERGLVHENIVKTLTASMRIDTMTDVQTKTINQTLNGIDT
jgi:ATP-dependent RNA helicase MSS116, mitochondrial